jgi:hypothetical protein
MLLCTSTYYLQGLARVKQLQKAGFRTMHVFAGNAFKEFFPNDKRMVIVAVKR